jgi:hypothetical protein
MIRNVLMPLLSAIAACAGCASMLGLDHDYAPEGVEHDSSSGGDVTSSNGGVVSGGSGDVGNGEGGSGAAIIPAGGRRAMVDAGMGGHAAGGAPVADAGSCDTIACKAGEKCCTSVSTQPPVSACVTEQPLIGCGQTGCDPCPPPPTNGVAVCDNNGACAVRCNEAYALSNGECVPMSTGSGGAGHGGTTGTGGKGTGGGPQCPGTDASRCGPCNIAGPVACCRHDQTCGCTWAPGVVCY